MSVHGSKIFLWIIRISGCYCNHMSNVQDRLVLKGFSAENIQRDKRKRRENTKSFQGSKIFLGITLDIIAITWVMRRITLSLRIFPQKIFGENLRNVLEGEDTKKFPGQQNLSWNNMNNSVIAVTWIMFVVAVSEEFRYNKMKGCVSLKVQLRENWGRGIWRERNNTPEQFQWKIQWMILLFEEFHWKVVNARFTFEDFSTNNVLGRVHKIFSGGGG